MADTARSYQNATYSEVQQAFHIARKRMVERQLIEHGITDARVLDAMAEIPRHCFVEEGLWEQSYDDRPLPIGDGQTISQPLIVAYMSQALGLSGRERILEIGTGCGYQSSILCSLAKEVFSIERIARLSHRARRHLYALGFMNFHLRIGDGTLGWPEAGPFDAILVAAGAPQMPELLLTQLADGGRAILPVGSEESQELWRITRRGAALEKEKLSPCRFVKLIGAHGWGDRPSL